MCLELDDVLIKVSMDFVTVSNLSDYKTCKLTGVGTGLAINCNLATGGKMYDGLVKERGSEFLVSIGPWPWFDW